MEYHSEGRQLSTVRESLHVYKARQKYGIRKSTESSHKPKRHINKKRHQEDITKETADIMDFIMKEGGVTE